MSISIFYANAKYTSGNHQFKNVIDGTNMSLTSLANAPSCNVMTIVNDKIGIGTTLPMHHLDIIGTLQTSNLRVLGKTEYIGATYANLQIPPIRKVFYVDTTSQNTFSLTTNGLYGGQASNVQIFVGQNLLKYYSDEITDYSLNISYTAESTTYTITLVDTVDYGSLVDITVWPTNISGSILPGSIYQKININNSWNYINSNDINYTVPGNIGIGITNPQQSLHVQGNTYVSGFIRAENMGMYRNRILNGDMRLTQRTSNFSVPNLIGSVNPVDRFYLYGTVAGKLTSQWTTDAPIGFTRSLMITSTSNYTPTSNDRLGLLQNIEGYNIYDCMFGSATATPISISFWVKSSLTGTFSLRLANGAENQSYVETYSITNSNLWEQKQIIIPGSTSGTWNTDGGIGLQLYFDLGGGSNTEGTARYWQGSNITRTIESTKLCQTNAATWRITGIQLEKGSLATPFDRKPLTAELTLSRSFFSAMENKNIYGYASAMQFGGYLDLGSFNGSLKGFLGGFTDGRYAYLVPHYNGAYHGLFTRVELNNWTTTGISFVNVATGNANAQGFHSGFTDGRYGYLVPHYNGAYRGILTRIDLQNFTTSGVSYLDVSTNNANAKCFIGGFTDGRYAYLVPWNNSAYHGILTRVDLQNFTTSGVTYLDVSTAGNTNAKGFHGGFTDGRYGYLVPHSNGAYHGILTRVDLQNFTISGVSYVNVSTGNANAAGFIGGFTDGRYGYLVPYNNSTARHGIFTRIDLQNFTTSGVTYLDVSTAGNTNAKGFYGGFTDGRYAYLVPNNNGAYNGILTRVELDNFTTSGVTYMDVSTFGNTGAKGFNGGFTDGRHAYLIPYNNGGYFGIFTRVFIANTLGNTSLGGSGNNGY